jgi:hypothetical protein
MVLAKLDMPSTSKLSNKNLITRGIGQINLMQHSAGSRLDYYT